MSAKIIKLENRRARWADTINKSWSMAMAAAQNAVKAGIATGSFLIQAKEDLPHGEFTAMVNDELQFSARKAQQLMRIARSPLTKASPASHLPAGWTILSELASLTENDFVWACEHGLITKDMTRDSATAIRKVRHSEDNIVRVGGNRQPPRGPTPKEARALARASGRLIVASDGRMYTGTTEDEDEEYGRKLSAVYGIKEACQLIAAIKQTPQQWIAQAEDHWIFEFDPNEISAAVGWLSELKPLLAKRLKAVRRA